MRQQIFLAWSAYLVLTILFCGVFVVDALLAGSFFSVFLIPLWGSYIVINIVLSLILTIVLPLNFKIIGKTYFYLMIIAFALAILDLPQMVGVARTSADNSHPTLLWLIFAAHVFFAILIFKNRLGAQRNI